ncbi:unnamed protein product [Thelazia callipaeda]|uniref:Cytochrome P450 4V2 n=1 Tax=Thelazia callipaeda TaxID=103827 RepID=A0A158RB28_THECL|nr:unnamed protein product [Thelazia callipaeda]
MDNFADENNKFFEQAQGIAYMLQNREERISRIWFGPWPWVLLYGAEECEAILGSHKLLKKPLQYNLLSGWIGQGLLISEPKKWRRRRKLLTPTFHYDILKDFIDVYNKHGRTLLSKFQKMCGEHYNEIFHTISLCTLDVICEAALGTHVDAQNKPSPYLDAVWKMKYMIHQRTLKAQFYSDIFNNWFGTGKEELKCIEALHEFTGVAIANRKKMADEAGKRRMAFLDLMLDMHAKGYLSLEGIQEEVDTFTFEAHDTTSASMNWFLHLMGTNPDIQAKVQREVDEILGEEDRYVTYEDLGQFKYLEACIKETLRMFPSVPIIARLLTEDTKIGNNILPSGTGVVIIASMVHRDPKYWPDPEVFKPERFISSELKHPYSYIPFSAGARNCIGQRFAIMEEKCVLALLMKHLKVKSKLRTDQMHRCNMKDAETACLDPSGNLLSSSPLPSPSASPVTTLSTAVNSCSESYNKRRFNKCMELLNGMLKESNDNILRCCLRANLALCEAKSKAEFFGLAYKLAICDIFPKFQQSGEILKLEHHCETVAAFNLALNAFGRYNHRTCLELIHSLLSTQTLSGYLASRQSKLALKQVTNLRDNPKWHKASVIQRDYLDCLDSRIRCLLYKTVPDTDINSSKLESLYWCLIQSECDMKNGNSLHAVNRLLARRPSLQDEGRRLVDNALGCIYALSLKKVSLADSYFRSAMLVKQKKNNRQESTIPRYCILYHAALTQLHCGQAESAFTLFLAVLPFYAEQPRIWLRIAECCIQVLTEGEAESEEPSIEIIGEPENGFIIFPSTSNISEKNSNEVVRENKISWEYAAICIRNALLLAGTKREYNHLLPWLYAASAFVDLNLGRYGLALKAACHLACLPQISAHHQLMAVLFKAEALVLLNRLPEALECLTLAIPIHSIPSTVSAVVYNQALLNALSGNFHKAFLTFSLVSFLGKEQGVRIPEALPLGVYINIKLDKEDEARKLLVQHLQEMNFD